LLWYVLFAALLAVISLFVVKLFASSAIALGDWSINWGANDETMETVVTPGTAPPGGTSSAPPALSEPAPPEGPALNAAETTSTDELHEPNAMLRGARNSIAFWKDMVKALASGYQAGFLWVAAVGVYLLMRRDIDGVQLNEVYIDPADEYGMPPLADEATTGVAEVVPGQPAQPGDVGR
jgi:hypothetical protein